LRITSSTATDAFREPRTTLFVKLVIVKRIHPSAWLLALSSGVLQVLVFPRPGLYFLCWLCLAPLIYSILRAREADASQLLAERDTFSYLVPATITQGFFLGWVSGFVTYAGSCAWVYHVMHLYGGLSPATSFGLLLLFSLFIGLHHAVFGALLAWAARSRAGFSRKALVLAPFLWVAVELLRTYVVSFPWNLLGTAQIDNTSLVRLAAVTGVYGISFEIALVNAAFAAAFLVRIGRRRTMMAAAVTAAVVLQATALVKFDHFPTDHTARLVQLNLPLNDEWTTENYPKRLQALVDLSTQQVHGAPAPSIVIWPESPGPFFVNDPTFLQALSKVAANGSYVIAGSLGIKDQQAKSPQLLYNSAVALGPSGTIQARYDKIHLVPWGEYVPYKSLFSFAESLTHQIGTFEPGTQRVPLQLGNTRFGVFICYESVFPDEISQFADHGAEVFVNISNDGWFGESGAPAQHLNMARMRAVENQRWILRATNTGTTAVIDPMGRVTSTIERNTAAVLDADFSTSAEATIYTRYGDWFPIGCAIISLCGLLWRERPETGPAEPTNNARNRIPQHG
jgi:apolipoprotein N-acyltransferase